MAKISEREPKKSSGGYERVFDDPEMGKLFSKVQSAVIANGFELEKIIADKFSNISNLDSFLKNIKNKGKGIYICPKNVLKKSEYYLKGNQPDLLIFDIRGKRPKCYIVELKDGDTFDTKKSLGEVEHLEGFHRHLSIMLDNVRCFYYFCCFNTTTIDLASFKNLVSEEHLLTGKEFCNMTNIDYEEIVTHRKEDGLENRNYFFDSLLSISSARLMIENKIKNK